MSREIEQTIFASVTILVSHHLLELLSLVNYASESGCVLCHCYCDYLTTSSYWGWPTGPYHSLSLWGGWFALFLY